MRLGVSSVGYVAPREGGPSVVLKLGDVIEGTQGVFFRSAVDEVAPNIMDRQERTDR